MIFLRDKYNVICVTVYLLILITFYISGLKDYDRVILYIVNFILCFGLYSIIFFRNKIKNEPSLYEILIISVIFRLVLLFIDPITSEDFLRYLWDGKVQYEGLNPFRFTPLELTQFHDSILYPFRSYPDIHTIYPPISQIIFYLSYVYFGSAVLGLKIFYLLFDIGILVFLYRALRHQKLNTNFIFLYSLSPVILFEFFINAHIDILLLFFLMGGLYFALNNKSNSSMFFLGMSVMSKTYSLIFLPLFILQIYKNKKSLVKLASGIICFLIPFLLIAYYHDGIMNLFLTMKNYMVHWYFNNLPYIIILTVNKFFGIDEHSLTRIILVVFFAIAYILILISDFEFTKKIIMIAFCYLFFSHTVHPWYITVLVLFLPLCFNYSVFFWSGIIGLTNLTVYYYMKDKTWDDFFSVLLIEYIGIAFFAYRDFKNIYQKSSS